MPPKDIHTQHLTIALLNLTKIVRIIAIGNSLPIARTLPDVIYYNLG